MKKDEVLKEIEKAKRSILNATKHKHYGTPLAAEHNVRILEVARGHEADPDVVSAVTEALELMPPIRIECKHAG